MIFRPFGTYIHLIVRVRMAEAEVVCNGSRKVLLSVLASLPPAVHYQAC